MMNCPVCQTATTPVKIGDKVFCSVCGTAATLAAGPASASPAAPVRPTTLDLSSRSRSAAAPAPSLAESGDDSVPPPTAPAPTPSPLLVLSPPPALVPTPSPAPTAAPTPTPAASASDLHARVKPSLVLDLRPAPAVATVAPPVVAQVASPAVQLTPVAAPTPVAPAQPPLSPPATTQLRRVDSFTNRIDKARQVTRSASINKFASGPQPSSPAAAPTAAPTPTAAPAAPNLTPTAAPISAPPANPVMDLVAKPAAAPPATLPELAATHHEAMTRLVPAVPAPTPPPPTAQASPGLLPQISLSPVLGRNLATATAVILMAGYVWMQNYPKLAMQTANNKAGLTASLPSFLPSSYNLKTTDTSPGLVTLNFTSPSASEALKIAQARTSWDSSSLLYNFVAKQTDDYASVQGQGLTIYLFNNNQATWVNHGIWYSIAGAGRLSREQILKIAYSL